MRTAWILHLLFLPLGVLTVIEFAAMRSRGRQGEQTEFFNGMVRADKEVDKGRGLHGVGHNRHNHRLCLDYRPSNVEEKRESKDVQSSVQLLSQAESIGLFDTKEKRARVQERSQREVDS